jgi:hypothetical protein
MTSAYRRVQIDAGEDGQAELFLAKFIVGSDHLTSNPKLGA